MSHHSRARKDTIRTRKRRLSSSVQKRSPGGCRPTTLYDAGRAYTEAKGKDRGLLETPLFKRIGGLYVHEIDQRLIDITAEELWPRASPATRNRSCYTPLSAVLKFSATQGWCPCWRISRPKSAKRSITLPTDAELYRFLHACRRLKRIAIFLLRTDATVSEALELDWIDIDFANRTARCVRPDGRERKIELGNKVLTMLAQTSVPLPVGRVFLTHRGKPYQRKKSGGGQLKTALANAAMETGIKINARILKQIRKARLLGTRPDIDEPDDTTRFEVVTRLIKSTLTKYRGLESNASAD